MPEYSTALLNQLKDHEGLRLKRYRDTEGHWTIGYGHNLDARPIVIGGIVNPKRISPAQAVQLLSEDIQDTVETLEGMCQVFKSMPIGPRREACVNMAFQMGVTGFKKFRKMRAAISERDWQGAVREMIDSEWHRKYTSRAVTLEKQMLSGEYEAKYL